MDEMVLLMVKRLLVDVLQELATAVPEGADDKKVLRTLAKQRQASDVSVIDVVRRQQKPLPASMWISIAASCLYHWDEGGETAALALSPAKDDTAEDGTAANLSAATDAFRVALAVMASVQPTSGDDMTYRTLGYGETLARALARLSAFMEGEDRRETAYDLLHFATTFLSDDDPLLEDVAREGLRLALLGGKPAQICLMSITVASVAVARATDDPNARLAAYAACEIAIERVALAPETLQPAMAERLLPVLELHPWLKHLRVRMTPFALNQAGLAKAREALGGYDWPTRVANVRIADWWTKSTPIFHLMRGEIDFENERLRLIKRVTPEQVTTDPIDWMFALSDYKHAVPHSGSLFKERNFPDKLGLLVHEITHVLTFLGGLGAALLALRVAGFRIATELWRFSEDSTPEEITAAFREKKGIASLEPNDAMLLLSAERQLDIRFKTLVLLDLWTAWIEGVAVFGELGADPELDEVGINPVLECLRNLVDVFAEAQEPGELAKELREHMMEFERQCSAALSQTGPGRLGDYLRGGDLAYLHGYLVVRAIASRWRLQTGRNLTSAQCFDVFLHATRYAVHAFIPDLSWPGDIFAAKAEEGLSSFVSALANLSAEEIEIYLRRADPNAPGQFIAWDQGRVKALNSAEVTSAMERNEAHKRILIRQALRSLTTPDALSRLSMLEPEPKALAEAFTLAGQERLDQILSETDALDSLTEIFESLFELGTVLPIGECSSPFFLHIDEVEDRAQLCVNVRTAEAFKDTGEPSYNGFWFPMSGELAKQLRDSYESCASPRLDITRVVVLSEMEVGPFKMRFPHMFAFVYPGWFGMRGTSQWAQQMEDIDKSVWDGLAAVVQRRLDSDEMRLIESRFIASGEEMINRTVNWLDQSANWHVDTEPVNVDSWAKHVRLLAERLLDDSARESARQKGVAAIISAIRGNENVVEAAATSFRTILGRKPGLSNDLVSAIYETARRSCDSDFLDQNAHHFYVAGHPLFEKGPFGWDVAPAKLAGDGHERAAVLG